MIKQILIAAMLVAPAVYADDKADLCKTVSSASGEFYDAVQNGVPMSAAFEAVSGSELGVVILKDAYKEPVFNTEEYKKKYRVQFQNRWYQACRGWTK